MDHDIVLPQLRRDSRFGKIVEWLREEGDRVSSGDSLLIMETDKATIELKAEVTGILTKVLHPAGQWVPAETPVGVIASRVIAGPNFDGP